MGLPWVLDKCGCPAPHPVFYFENARFEGVLRDLCAHPLITLLAPWQYFGYYSARRRLRKMTEHPSMTRRALLVVAKRPAPGRTKTRLCPPLTSQAAADLYRRLLLDTLDLIRSGPDVHPFIAYLPYDAADYFRALAPDLYLLPQEGTDLGAQLDNALTHCLRNGFRQAVIMNSDGPTLPVVNLFRAFELLDEGADVVLGPCEDGGYYLVGITTPQPGLFRGMHMSTPTVLEETLARAAAGGLSVAKLASWYDVDTAADLKRLADELSAPGCDTGRHTQSFLDAHPQVIDF